MDADILPFLTGRAFDEEATKAMGQAFDVASRNLHDRGQPAIVREIIARRIIDVASRGERDPEELARRALMALGIETVR
jgi:hypothetical protein